MATVFPQAPSQSASQFYSICSLVTEVYLFNTNVFSSLLLCLAVISYFMMCFVTLVFDHIKVHFTPYSKCTEIMLMNTKQKLLGENQRIININCVQEVVFVCVCVYACLYV